MLMSMLFCYELLSYSLISTLLHLIVRELTSDFLKVVSLGPHPTVSRWVLL